MTYDFNGLLSPAFYKAIEDEKPSEIPNISIPVDIFKVDVESFLTECEKLANAKPQKRSVEKSSAEVIESMRPTRKPLAKVDSNTVSARVDSRGRKSFVELTQPPAISRNTKYTKINLF